MRLPTENNSIHMRYTQDIRIPIATQKYIIVIGKIFNEKKQSWINIFPKKNKIYMHLKIIVWNIYLFNLIHSNY